MSVEAYIILVLIAVIFTLLHQLQMAREPDRYAELVALTACLARSGPDPTLLRNQQKGDLQRVIYN